MPTVHCLLDCKNLHGEGIFWNPQDSCVWWTDIEGRKLWQHHPETGDSQSYDMPDRVCCFAPRQSGGFIVAFAKSIALCENVQGPWKEIFRFEPENPQTRTNDGRTDRQGRFLVGGMNEGTGEYDSSVVLIDTDHSVKTLIEGVSCANSTCFSPQGQTLYFADSPKKEILSYDYDPVQATATNPRLYSSFLSEPGLPDGSCVGMEGCVWNAEWSGRRVVRISQEGTINQIVDIPALNPTCCTFGGEELDTIFVTTSRQMMSEKDLEVEPLSGGLFAFKPGVKGLVDTPFKG